MAKASPDEIPELVLPRIYLFLEVVGFLLLQAILAGIFMTIFTTNFPDPNFQAFLMFLGVAIASVIAIPIVLAFSTFFKTSLKQNPNEFIPGKPAPQKKPVTSNVEEIPSPLDVALTPFKALRVPKSSWKSQIRWTLIFIFLIFIPIDFLLYLFPGFLEFTANSIAGSKGDYLFATFSTFLLASIFTHTCVGFYEEFTFRGFILLRGSQRFSTGSAIIISACFFGLGHFNYYFSPTSEGMPVTYPIIWAAGGCFVGIVLGTYLAREGHLLPLIIAHAVNNVVSTISLWNYLNVGHILNVIWYVYLPSFVIGLVLLVLQRSHLKEGASVIFEQIREYFRQKPLVFIVDIAVILGLWLIALFI